MLIYNSYIIKIDAMYVPIKKCILSAIGYITINIGNEYMNSICNLLNSSFSRADAFSFFLLRLPTSITNNVNTSITGTNIAKTLIPPSPFSTNNEYAIELLKDLIPNIA